MFRALALDLDGTLLLPNETVSDRTLAALTAATEAGIEVIIASARWSVLAERIARLIPGTKLVVACSGAQVMRLDDHADIFDVRLDHDFTHELEAFCDTHGGVATLAYDDSVFVRLDSPPASNPARPELNYIERFDGADRGRARIALVQGTETMAAVAAQLEPKWQHTVRFTEARTGSGRRIYTLTAHGADKGLALAHACDALGFDVSQAIAFGDSENDIEMFQVAGAAVAMGNATDAARAASTHTTLPNTEDGVAIVVERLLATGSI